MTSLSQDTDTRSVADVLDAAADLLSKPGAWTQGWFAYDRRKTMVASVSRKAICWCAQGAISASTATQQIDARKALAKVIGNSNIAAWNDAPERTQEEVVRAFREAAQASRQEQQKGAQS